MERTFACVLLLLSWSATFSKYVFISDKETWHGAQGYCRLFHTDLAPISDIRDMWKLKRVDGYNGYEMAWIGLKRNSRDRDKWTWSGGGEVFTFFWKWDQPNNRQNEDYGLLEDLFWHDATPNYKKSFFCYSAIVVRERKTWLEALEYCRKHHHNLASVASETEMLLIKKEIAKNEITSHVWIGLHFFSGHWLWVDGEPTTYNAWGPEGKPGCPEARRECAAMPVIERGQTSNSTNAPPVTDATAGPVVYHAGGDGANIFGVSTAGVKKHVWQAHDCEASLYFVCY